MPASHMQWPPSDDELTFILAALPSANDPTASGIFFHFRNNLDYHFFSLQTILFVMNLLNEIHKIQLVNNRFRIYHMHSE